MDSKKDKLHDMLHKSKWNRVEKMWLLDYLKENGDNAEELRGLMWQQFKMDQEEGEHSFDAQELLTKIYVSIEQQQSSPNMLKRTSRRHWIVVAAVCIGALFCSIYFFVNKDERNTNIATVDSIPLKQEILPGANKAILTRADGSRTILEAENEDAYTGVDSIIRIENGKITYNSSTTSGSAVHFNMITTPRSGHYQVQLPDGTEVWLNAASSIRFPIAFTGNERKVEIQGEVYFDVKNNPKKPFIVQVGGAEIKVVGTRFNVMAYPDEKVLETTLLEGSVIFSNKSEEQVVLKPGQQSLLSKSGQISVRDQVNIDNVIAWKDGFFDFDGDNIESVTRELARWYDVEIVLNKSSKDLFYARIPKNTLLSDVLKALELTGKVRFKIHDRKINVIV